MATKQAHDKLEFNFEPNPWFVDESQRTKAMKAIAKAETMAAAAESLGINASTLRLIPVVEEDGLIPFRNQSELAKKVVKERQGGTSWAQIGARSGGLTERRVQSLYEEEAGEPYVKADIGKGGRPLGSGSTATEDETPKAKAKKSTKKAAPKKAAAKSTKKAATKGKAKAKGNPFPDPDSEGGDDEAIEKAILGNVVTVEGANGKTFEREVAEVVKFGNSKSGARGVQIKDTDGKMKTLNIAKIVSIA